METCFCRGCRRPIRSARSIRTGYGPRCYTRKRIRANAMREIIGQYRPSPGVTSMALLVHSHGEIRRVRKDIYRVRSLRDRSRYYLCSPRGCNCEQYLKRSKPAMCYHRLAAILEECG
jgi:hypothetical protein